MYKAFLDSWVSFANIPVVKETSWPSHFKTIKHPTSSLHFYFFEKKVSEIFPPFAPVIHIRKEQVIKI